MSDARRPQNSDEKKNDKASTTVISELAGITLSKPDTSPTKTLTTSVSRWIDQDIKETKEILRVFWNEKIIKKNQESIDGFKKYLKNECFNNSSAGDEIIENIFKDAHLDFDKFCAAIQQFPLRFIHDMNKGENLIPHKETKELAKLGGVMTDSVSNVVSTKLFSNIAHEIAYLNKYLNSLVGIERRLMWKNLKANFIQGCFVTLLIGLMLIALIHGRMQGYITPGDFAFVLTLSISFILSLEDIRQRMLEFTKVVGTCNQALSYIRMPHEIIDVPHALPLTVTKGEIKFDHVCFKHANTITNLFNNLNITINAGEKVGLVGYSGGGKSTFIKLILRLLDAQSGSVLIDNQDIKQIIKHSLRTQIGTIPQDPELFHRTILDNIRFAKPDATDEEVIEAAKKAKCHEFISELPEGYQSLVGERGIKLSGGQKQRIAIARAFLKNAPILLLDEATSSLDSVTERQIQKSLHEVMLNRTTIVIAHRLSTLKDMDRILVFVKGTIVEDGSLDDLLKNTKGHFYKLWNMQAEGFIPNIKEQ